MPKRLSKKKQSSDPALTGFAALQRVIDLTEGPQKSKVIPMRKRKNPAAVELGRKGGKASAKARMEKIPEAERRRIASAAARARWAKDKGDD
ncbi:MAG TPA: hypothetical protein VFA59_18230 [Vicinamibacterales bacterium]|nr:hypothetical protein [Vicinamibacterales bacterium]